MANSTDFLQYVKDQLSEWDEINLKRMFGVVGLYREGLMFGIVSSDSVYLKVDQTNKNKFVKSESKPLRLFKSDSEVASFYELPVDVIENADLFLEWAKESYTIQLNKSNKKSKRIQNKIT